MLDVLDLRILKYVCRDMDGIYYLNELSKSLRLRKSLTRIRLKKLCRLGFIKEVKVYPRYYVPNPLIKRKMDELNVPEGFAPLAPKVPTGGNYDG